MTTISPINGFVNFRGVTPQPADGKKPIVSTDAPKGANSDSVVFGTGKGEVVFSIPGPLQRAIDETKAEINWKNITPEQKEKLDKRVENGLNKDVAQKIKRLPAQCIDVLLATDKEGNPYVPSMILNKIGKDYEITYASGKDGKINGDMEIKTKDGKLVGSIKRTKSKTFEENDTTNTVVKFKDSTFTVSDVNSKDIPMPASWTYTADTGLFSLFKSGYLMEIPDIPEIAGDEPIIKV